jgi:cell division protease FtsH
LAVHTRRTPLADDVELEVVARGTPGFSGADLENLVNESALQAARRNSDKVAMVDLEFAKDKILMGAERRSLIISEKEKRNTAFHEAGHVLVAKKLDGVDPVHKVTIIPRGQAMLGQTQQLPMEDRLSMDRTFALNTISVLMGGRIAEELALGAMTTGAGNDIERATEIARKMVCEWGMSPLLGPLSFGQREEQIFLGREINRHKDYSEKTAEAIDAEVRRIIDESYQRAREILEEHREILQTLATELLDREALDAQEIDVVLAGEALPVNGQDGGGTPMGEKEKETKHAPIFKPAPAMTALEDPEKA